MGTRNIFNGLFGLGRKMKKKRGGKKGVENTMII